jgi:hypothetical protein
MEILGGVIGGILALVETLQLFVLSDLRDRISRIENHFLDKGWTGEERRRTAIEVRTGDRP